MFIFCYTNGGVNEKGRLPSRIDRDFKSRLAFIWSKMVVLFKKSFKGCRAHL